MEGTWVHLGRTISLGTGQSYIGATVYHDGATPTRSHKRLTLVADDLPAVLRDLAKWYEAGEPEPERTT